MSDRLIANLGAHIAGQNQEKSTGLGLGANNNNNG
jgi:hypothetical protein